MTQYISFHILHLYDQVMHKQHSYPYPFEKFIDILAAFFSSKMDLDFTGSFWGEKFVLANRLGPLSVIDSLVLSNTKLTATFQILF